MSRNSLTVPWQNNYTRAKSSHYHELKAISRERLARLAEFLGQFFCTPHRTSKKQFWRINDRMTNNNKKNNARREREELRGGTLSFLAGGCRGPNEQKWSIDATRDVKYYAWSCRDESAADPIPRRGPLLSLSRIIYTSRRRRSGIYSFISAWWSTGTHGGLFTELIKAFLNHQF